MDNPIVSVALDGVLAARTDDPHRIGTPLGGAYAFLAALDPLYRIHVHTERTDLELVRAWLSVNDMLPYVWEVSRCHVPGAVAIISDRAIQFSGNHDRVYEILDYLGEHIGVVQELATSVTTSTTVMTEIDVDVTVQDGPTTKHRWHASVAERHPDSQQFHDLLEELGQLHDRKQADYGSSRDPFYNVQRSELIGVDPYRKCFSEMSDKMSRIESWSQKGGLKNESLLDTLQDMAVWSIIAIVMLNRAGLLDHEPSKA